MQRSQEAERRRIAELELEQARYEAQLAERRYAACDPENRLIAAQLEQSWEAALRRVRACEEKLEARADSRASSVDVEALEGLADDLQAAWSAPTLPCAPASGSSGPSSTTLLQISTRRPGRSSCGFTGKEVSIPSCEPASPRRVNTVGVLRTRPLLWFAAWPAGGPTIRLRLRSIG